MTEISFEFTKEGGFTSSFQGAFLLVLDGRKTTDYLDEAGFILSSEKEGLFPMLVGGCQTMGCCGTYIEVKHEGDKIKWIKFWHGGCGGEPEPEDEKIEHKFLEDFIIKPPLIFDREKYKMVAEKLRNDLKEKPNYYEHFLKEYDRYSSGDTFNI